MSLLYALRQDGRTCHCSEQNKRAADYYEGATWRESDKNLNVDQLNRSEKQMRVSSCEVSRSLKWS